MFDSLGQFVQRRWKLILGVWFVLLAVAVASQAGWLRVGWLKLRFHEVVVDGEFAYLPPTVPSLVGEAMLAKAFPDDQSRSSVVIVVRREGGPLQQSDLDFIADKDADSGDPEVVTLALELKKIKDDRSLWKPQPGGELPETVITRIRTHVDKGIAQLLNSPDGKASLVVIECNSEFLEWRNRDTIDRIQKLVAIPGGDLFRAGKVPQGLDMAMSGTATVGRDMNVAQQQSSRATEVWTITLVVLLLLAIYRAPIVAFIPLLTVFAARQTALTIIALATQIPGIDFRAFTGMEIYITVVLYGAGVDYCLFLIARYKEELDSGASSAGGAGAALARVGEAVTASAATVICGIGMMYFAEFGKFQAAGIAIALALTVGLFAALTFTPALMCWAGRIAFWPHGMSEHIPGYGRNVAGTTLIGRLIKRDKSQIVWEWIGQWLVRRPGLILIVSIALMLPFSVIGVRFHNHLSYGLLSELPKTSPSVVGAEAVKLHFPPGFVAPITVVLQSEQHDFLKPTSAGREELLEPLIAKFIKSASPPPDSPPQAGDVEPPIVELTELSEDLGITDIRYVDKPLGQSERDEPIPGVRPPWQIAMERAAMKAQANRYYVTQQPELGGRLTRFQVITNSDPFSPDSISKLERIAQAIADALPAEHRGGTQVAISGATASIRDLKAVTDRDQIRIDVLVLAATFLILVVLLRQVAVSVYLIISVFFSYLVTLGVTFVLFWALDPQGFAGLDWKVPIFLFTILIAVGEDYNIFLMTRITEEQQRYGPVEGIRMALLKTGGIISSCGVIMAGTFCSLMLAGALVGMVQLGFALAFGVLLDTFVVRPILVPAYLILVNNGRFGSWSKVLGAVAEPPAIPLEAPREPESTPVR